MGFFDRINVFSSSKPVAVYQNYVSEAKNFQEATNVPSDKLTNYTTRDNWTGWVRDRVFGLLRKDRDLNPSVMQELNDKLYLAYRSNPIIFRACEIIAEFVVGDEGIQYKAQNKFVKQILDIHWLNPINNWTLMQHDRLRDLGLFGEVVIPTDVNPINGAVALGNIDTKLIDYVVYDPVIQMRPIAVVLNSSVANEQYKRVYKVISEADPNLLKDANSQLEKGRLIGLKTEKITGFAYKKDEKVPEEFLPRKIKGQISSDGGLYKWAGECFYFQINNPLTSSRGLSDFTSVLDWAELHDEYMFESGGKAIRSGMTFTDVTIKGGTEQSISHWIKNNPEPTPGGRLVHNEQVSVEIKTPDLKTQQVAETGATFKNHVLAGVGLAPHWFSEASAARAVAPEMNEPTFKHFRHRQRVFAYIVGYIFRFVIDQAIIHNRLRAPNDADYYLIFPQMSRKDHRMTGSAIKDFTEALKNGIESKFLTPQQANDLFSEYVKLASIEIGKSQPRLNAKDETEPKFSNTVDNSDMDNLPTPSDAMKNMNKNDDDDDDKGGNGDDKNKNNNNNVNGDKSKKESVDFIAESLKVRGFQVESAKDEDRGVYRFIAHPSSHEAMMFENLIKEYKEYDEDDLENTPDKESSDNLLMRLSESTK